MAQPPLRLTVPTPALIIIVLPSAILYHNNALDVDDLQAVMESHPDDVREAVGQLSRRSVDDDRSELWFAQHAERLPSQGDAPTGEPLLNDTMQQLFEWALDRDTGLGLRLTGKLLNALRVRALTASDETDRAVAVRAYDSLARIGPEALGGIVSSALDEL
jgi:hypothetical protein